MKENSWEIGGKRDPRTVVELIVGKSNYKRGTKREKREERSRIANVRNKERK